MSENHLILKQLDDERRRLARMGETRALLPHITRLRSGDPPHYGVIWSSLNDVNADAAIAAEIEYHRAIGVPFEWKVYAHDTPPDLPQHLEQHGFSIGPCEAVMLFDLSQTPAWMRETGPARVERIERPEQIAIYRRLAETITGKDYSFTADDLAEALRQGSAEHGGYLAWSEQEPVSIARLYTHPQSHFAGLYGAATLESHRGRGFYRALVAARARDALAAGARYLIVDALPTSRPILERLSFRRVTDTWPCDWRPEEV
jgi:GNAT superfamily N-acetyltransferase